MLEETKITAAKLNGLYAKLYDDLGYQIIRFLAEESVSDIMLNPNGQIWVDSLTAGQVSVGYMSSKQAFSILEGVARINNVIVDSAHPCVEGKLPIYKELKGQRFTGQVPPVVSNPTFAICKQPEIYSLYDYLLSERISEEQLKILLTLISAHKNILICGEAQSGKTTLLNAIIAEAVLKQPNERFHILETENRSLVCNASNKVEMLTTAQFSMAELLKRSRRMPKGRLLIDEIKGSEVLELLDILITDNVPGIATIEGSNAEEGLQHFYGLSQKNGSNQTIVSSLFRAIDVVVTLDLHNTKKGCIKEIVTLEGFENEKFKFSALDYNKLMQGNTKLMEC